MKLQYDDGVDYTDRWNKERPSGFSAAGYYSGNGDFMNKSGIFGR